LLSFDILVPVLLQEHAYYFKLPFQNLWCSESAYSLNSWRIKCPSRVMMYKVKQRKSSL
jgi:hypothetical protein